MAAFFYPIAMVYNLRPPTLEEHVVRRLTDCKLSPSLPTSIQEIGNAAANDVV